MGTHTIPALLGALALFTGCSLDIDADGYLAIEDCDDADPAVHPDAAELCNGVDDDCDGDVDEAGADGERVWYADGDSDGFGDPDTAVMACEAPTGSVADATDCDDDDAAINPSADEIWYDDIDQDCDGASDHDADADGYEAASGDGEDCDDGDADVHPDAEEVCSNGKDDDCDGTDSGCGLSGEISLADADAKLLGTQEGDNAGYGVAFTDHNSDGLDDLIVAVVDPEGRSTRGSYYRAVAVITSPESSDIGLTEADGLLYGPLNESTWEVVGLSGEPGDWQVGLIAGAYQSEVSGYYSGAAYVWYGPVTGTHELVDGDGLLLGPEDTYAWFGWSLSGLDADADGVGDVLVGAPYEYTGESADFYYLFPGAAYLFLGPVTGELAAESADARLEGDVSVGTPFSAYDHSRRTWFGAALSQGGDANGDGIADVLIGARYVATSDGDDAGAAYYFEGPHSGEIAAADADGAWFGDDAGDLAGFSVDLLGDVDGDGAADLGVGVQGYPGGERTGGVAIITGPSSSTSSIAEAATAWWEGEATSDNAGARVRAAGDVNGDGAADVAVGARCGGSCAEAKAGTVYLLHGPLSAGTFSLSAADVTLRGELAGDLAGSYGLAAGDTNGDGLSDLLIGAPYNDEVATGAGVAYLILGAGF